MNIDKLKEIIIKAVPDIVEEFEEQETVLENIGYFVRQSVEKTGRKYTYERPITLSDVLIALKIDEVDGSDDRLSKAEAIILMWDKYNNNLDNQSDETKKFLIDLLCQK